MIDKLCRNLSLVCLVILLFFAGATAQDLQTNIITAQADSTELFTIVGSYGVAAPIQYDAADYKRLSHRSLYQKNITISKTF